MAVSKKRTQKKTEQTEDGQVVIRSLLDRIERVDIGSLKSHPKNPRIGNVDAIRESLRINSQYRPLMCQASTKYILAGNHTWLAARKEGWSKIDVVMLDVDDEAAKRILLADNKTSDSGTYDQIILAEVLAGLNGTEGTGYSAADIQDIIDVVNKKTEVSAKDAANDLRDFMSNMPDVVAKKEAAESREEYAEERREKGAGKERGVMSSAPEPEQDIDEIDDIEDVQTELQALLEFKEENAEYHKDCDNDFWGIPALRQDMLLDKLPENLGTWGGHEATPDDGKKWFLYNYSLGGIKGLPFDRTILAFNTHDDKFEGWWENPSWYTSKVISQGCRIAVVPDFSFYYTTPRVIHLFNVYRAQWLGRFFQEAGMKVIPRLQFDYTDDKSLEIALRGIPRGCPVLATSQQNAEEKSDEKRIQRLMQEALDEIKPKQLLYYSGPNGKRIMDKVAFAGDVVHCMNYVGVRREIVYGKKAGLDGLKKKDRTKKLEAARKKYHPKNDEAPEEKSSEEA